MNPTFLTYGTHLAIIFNTRNYINSLAIDFVQNLYDLRLRLSIELDNTTESSTLKNYSGRKRDSFKKITTERNTATIPFPDHAAQPASSDTASNAHNAESAPDFS